ncbi:hypothetical protein HPB52_003718 [Rhipicephalus sanguineus]|uniref:SMP-30/Gluconolactonase/LRE-like region domain-containing protein n=1 Tax=Rhipicephalus sanguineus TaxID=34632 RepID=A0A9D4QD68_RHISA|nr:hypothetical protein HPB52_003718 [Rhipicephalus sanguineus]
MKLEVASTRRSLLGEGPHWDERSSTLLFVDCLGRQVVRYDPASGLDTQDFTWRLTYWQRTSLLSRLRSCVAARRPCRPWLTTDYRALATSGAFVSFHWRPSHVGIDGNEEADTLAKAAHLPGTPISGDEGARDYTQDRIRKLLVTVYPDPRVAKGGGE